MDLIKPIMKQSNISTVVMTEFQPTITTMNETTTIINRETVNNHTTTKPRTSFAEKLSQSFASLTTTIKQEIITSSPRKKPASNESKSIFSITI